MEKLGNVKAPKNVKFLAKKLDVAQKALLQHERAKKLAEARISKNEQAILACYQNVATDNVCSSFFPPSFSNFFSV